MYSPLIKVFTLSHNKGPYMGYKYLTSAMLAVVCSVHGKKRSRDASSELLAVNRVGCSGALSEVAIEWIYNKF